MIQIQDVSKSFGDVKALDKVSLAASVGELIVLLGPNGAGKTTLMRLICGYLFPDAGKIAVNGAVAGDNLPEYLGKIGYMPENVPLYSEMKAGEYLQFVAAVYRLPPEQRCSRIGEIAAKLEIADILPQKIAALSKGYKKRVGLAAAILHQPKILVLDEPTEGMDPNQKIIVRRLLCEYAKSNLVLVSTHLLEEAEAMSSRIWVMAGGKVAADTTVDNLKAAVRDNNLASAFYNITRNKQEEN